jgi:hypothetical protein
MISSKGEIGGWSIGTGGISKGDTLINADDTVTYQSLMTDGESPVRFSVGGDRTITRQAIWDKSDVSELRDEEGITITVPCDGKLSSISVKRVWVRYYDPNDPEEIDIEGYSVDINLEKKTFKLQGSNATYNGTAWKLHVLYEYVWVHPSFKILNDGSMYAASADIVGAIHANDGDIGAFKITNDGLSSSYITLNSDSIFFPTQGSLNLSNNVTIFNEGKVSYIATSGKRDFEIKNMGGAGIRFKADKDNQTVYQSVTITPVTERDPTSEYGNHILYFEYEVSNNGVLATPLVLGVWCKFGNGKYKSNKEFQITIPAFNNNGRCEQTEPGLGTALRPVTISKTNSNYGDTITETVTDIHKSNNILYSLGSFCPNVPDGGSNVTTYTVGDDDHIWASIRTQTASITSSDIRLKNDVANISEKYETFFDGLSPVSFKYNDGSSDRKHLGFIAQDVETSLQKAGISTKDFAGICIGKDENQIYALRYEEFIPLNTYEIQKLKARVLELEELVGRLEEKLNTTQND